MPKQKKPNPFSSIGLDKFAHLNAELSAQREQVAKKKGVPKDAVRFAYHSKGWVPVLLKNSNQTSDGHNSEEHRAAGDSNMAPVETKAIQERKFERDEYMETNWKGGLEGIHGAIGMIVALACMIFQGTLCAILWACAWCWWCVLAKIRKGKHTYFDDNKSRIRMTIDLELKREMANKDSRDVSEKDGAGSKV